MNIFKLAFCEITRNRTKTLLFITVTALLFCAVVFSLCVYREEQRQIEQINQDYGSLLTVQRYQIAASPDVTHFPPQIRLEDCNAFEEMQYVDTVQVNSFIYVAKTDSSNAYVNNSEFSWDGWHLFVVGYNMQENNVFTDLVESDYLDGRPFANDAECVISNATATKYALKIGDLIKIEDNGTGTAAEYQLVGIVNSTDMESRFIDTQYYGNYIFTTMGGAENFSAVNNGWTLYNTDSPLIYYDGYNFSIQLSSYQYYNDFQALLSSDVQTINGYDYGYIVRYAKGGYERLIAPLQELATLFLRLSLLFIILFLGFAIVSVAINAKTQRYQFGVLRSMGMSKRRLGLYFFINQLMLYIGSILVGVIVAFLLLTYLNNGILEALSISEALFVNITKISIYAVLAVTLTAFVAALHASRLNPLSILRN